MRGDVLEDRRRRPASHRRGGAVWRTGEPACGRTRHLDYRRSAGSARKDIESADCRKAGPLRAEEPMRAVLCNGFDGIKALSIGEAAEPRPGADEVLIDVHAACVSFADYLMLCGGYQKRPALPYVPRMDAVGVVVACGEHVQRFRPGDWVACGAWFGSLAERTTAKASFSARLPGNADFVIGRQTQMLRQILPNSRRRSSIVFPCFTHSRVAASRSACSFASLSTGARRSRGTTVMPISSAT